MDLDPRVLLQKANKALQSASGGFSFFGSKVDKYENAADLFTQAANAFRMQNQSKEAGLAFEKAASIQADNLNEPDDAANSMQEAFKVYRENYPDDAARVLPKAIDHYASRGKLSRAATQLQHLAELYEVELKDMDKAVEAYEKAADWFQKDNAKALANKNYLKSADLAAVKVTKISKNEYRSIDDYNKAIENYEKLGDDGDDEYKSINDYYKAIENYEKVARFSVNNNLMKWSVKDYFLKAGICHLATNDLVATNRAIESYRDIDPTFASTREHQLLVDIVQTVEQGDHEAFSDKLFQYDQLSKLDSWKVTLFMRIKKKIESVGEDFS